jgi:hypothetical protein
MIKELWVSRYCTCAESRAESMACEAFYQKIDLGREISQQAKQKQKYGKAGVIGS